MGTKHKYRVKKLARKEGQDDCVLLRQTDINTKILSKTLSWNIAHFPQLASLKGEDNASYQTHANTNCLYVES